jgi:hypothetical protein
VYEDFIIRKQEQHGKAKLVKFIVETPGDKTDFMFNFFKLTDLEVNSINASQGVTPLSPSQQLMLDALRAQIQNQPALAQEILKLVSEEQGSKVSAPMIAEVIDNTYPFNFSVSSFGDIGDKGFDPNWAPPLTDSGRVLAIGNDVVLALPPPDSSDNNGQP